MGRYSDNLAKRFRVKRAKSPLQDGERLIACAIIRNGVTESRGFKEHWRIRAALGDSNPHESNTGDQEGFITSNGRFVNRYEARLIAEEAGQAVASIHPLLSSDINW